MSEDFNMVCAFRSWIQMGTSQQAIEEALRDAGETTGRQYEAKMVLTITELDMEHIVTGKIEGQS